MSIMMFPTKLLQWLQVDQTRALMIGALPSGGWFVTIAVMENGESEPKAEGTARTPGEAIIVCWENYLKVCN